MLQIDCGANCFQCSKLVVSICKWKSWGLYLVDGLMMFDVPRFVLVLFSFWVGDTWPYITYLVPDHWITCFTFWGVKAHFHPGLLLFFFMELVQRLMWISATILFIVGASLSLFDWMIDWQLIIDWIIKFKYFITTWFIKTNQVRDWSSIAPDHVTFEKAFKIRKIKDSGETPVPVPGSFIFAKRSSGLSSFLRFE